MTGRITETTVKRIDSVMSGLFDKKTESANHRQARTQKEQKAKRKTRIVSISVVSALALVFLGALFVNSNFIRRTLPAVTIGGIKFSAAEFDYFYNSAFFEYNDWINQQLADMPELVDSMLPSRDSPHSSQIYDPDTGDTWADFFSGRAMEQMSSLVQFYNTAMAAGFKITDETRDNVEYQVTGLLAEGEYYSSLDPQNYPNAESYLKRLYGGSMTEGVLRKILTFVYTAVTYSEQVRDGFAFSDAEIEAYYLENRDDLDVFRYRVLLVPAETVYESDYDTDEEFAEAEEAALVYARNSAHEIAFEIFDEEGFIEAALMYDEYSYPDGPSTLAEQQGETLEPALIPWLMDEARYYGEVTTIDLDYGTAVLFYIERDDNDYYTTAMRQMLFMRETVSPAEFEYGEDDPAYTEALIEADSAARQRAEAVFDKFTFGGSTEDKLLELIETEESDDTTEGGYYAGMTRFPYQYRSRNEFAMKVVPEIEDWLFSGYRQPGDSGLVSTEAYGYHLLYFMGYGQRFRDLIATDRLVERDFTGWTESLPEVEAKKNWAFLFTTF